MAVLSFKDRIIDLAGSLGTADDDAIQQWLLDGCYDVINKLQTSGGVTAPAEFAVQSSGYTSSMTVSLDSIREVISVQRDGIQCKLIPFSKSKYANPNTTLGADSIYKATSFDPVFYKHNNSLVVLPNPTATEQGYYSYIPEYSVSSFTSTSANVDNFPKQYFEYIVLYAAIATLDRQLLDLIANTDITTAFTAINTELDETQGKCDLMDAEIVLAKAEVADALTEIGEAIGLVDNASNIQVAVDAMNTATDKFRLDNSNPGLFGDAEWYVTGAGVGMTKVKLAVDNAISLIGFTTAGDKYNANYDLEANMADIDSAITDEDVEIADARIKQAQTQMSAVSSHLSVAKTHLEEWQATTQTLVAEINAFASEASTRYGWINAKAVVWKGELEAAQGYMGTASGYANEIKTKIGIAQGYASEAKIRMERDTQQYQWYQEKRNNLKQEYISKFPRQGTQGGK